MLFFAGAQLTTEAAELLLFSRRKPRHDLHDAAGMLRKNSGNQLSAGGSDAGYDEALVTSLLPAFGQAAFFKVVNDKSEIAAAGKNSPRQISQVQRAEMIKSFQHRELTQGKICILQPNARISHGRVGGAGQFHICIQGAFLVTVGFRVPAHSEIKLTANDAKNAKKFSKNSSFIASSRRPRRTSLLDIKVLRMQEGIRFDQNCLLAQILHLLQPPAAVGFESLGHLGIDAEHHVTLKVA